MPNIYSIKNDFFSAQFSEVGAELQSLRRLSDGRELIWHGDANWWNGRSPILFPITGGLWDGQTRFDGAPYSISKHGFVRRATWQLEQQAADAITFRFSWSADTLEHFPYRFNLRAHYRLLRDGLAATFEVENLEARAMPFQLGGHPAFVFPDFDETAEIDGFLKMDSMPPYLLRAGRQGCIECEDGQPKHYPLPLRPDGLVALGVETFRNEALIAVHAVGGATLLDRARRPFLRIESAAPVWLFWAPCGKHCPFVCCEPWFGLPDAEDFSGSFAERPFVQTVEGGEVWSEKYTILGER